MRKNNKFKYSKDFLVGLYQMMVRIRVCEESFVDPILRKEILCPVHLYSGEEAVAVGVCAVLSPEDYIFGTHRSHGHYLAKGGNLRSMVAEVYCKETGCAKGRGGSMHLLAPEVGMMGAAPIVAGTISLAMGTALAASIRRDGRVAVSFFGDGAAGEGVLYESTNFAALHCLPILFVCENNLYSTHLPIHECRPKVDIAQIGKAFGIPTFRVNGNQVLKVFEAAQKAIALCRQGSGPVFMECLTYRLRGHVGPDDNIQGSHTDIRPAKEVARWRRKDPIPQFARFLLKKKMAKHSELDRIQRDAEEEVRRAHEYAKASPYPKPEEMGKYLFKES
jgi:TPP-dependent pyruvate/acetoin dehydrogenase alpha subunit